MSLVAGVDSSTQSCTVVVCDADSGEIARHGSAPHPAGTSIDPQAWWAAMRQALCAAGGLEGVAAVSVAAQQHGMICLDADGMVVREALLWNDTRSAGSAQALVRELPGGATSWAQAVGSVPLASFTIAKLRWLAEHEPDRAERTAAVCLPHDWLSWQLRAATGLDELRTDRSDASGTGYWSPASGSYRPDLLARAFGQAPHTPHVLAPADLAGRTPAGTPVAAGSGDNAAAALGVGATSGEVVISIGTSGVVSAVSAIPTADPSAEVAGFADATGAFLPLACTLNAARVLEAAARMLGVDLAALSELALRAPSGADGLVLIPYFDGERTPNRPQATAALHGMRNDNTTPANLARAAIEGLLCGLADGLDALRAQGVSTERALLIGGAARSPAVRMIAPGILGVPVLAPPPAEYTAIGAARQAAWSISSHAGPPQWSANRGVAQDAPVEAGIRDRYRQLRELTAMRTTPSAESG